jgi:nucleotide-binding universal stress UspA family protein
VGGTIVCAVDDSRGAREAVRAALELSDRLGLRLVLAHVVEQTPPRGEKGNEGARKDSFLERLVDGPAPAVPVDERVEAGERAETLAEIAAEEAAALIVLGARRRRLLRPRPRSRLVAELSSASPCPVVVVPSA